MLSGGSQSEGRRESIKSRGAREGAVNRARAVGWRDVSRVETTSVNTKRVERDRWYDRGELVGSPLREDGGGEEEPCHRNDHSIPTARRPTRRGVIAEHRSPARTTVRRVVVASARG